MKKNIYKLFVYIQILFIAFTPYVSYSQTMGLGGWNIVETTRQGASTIINATRTVVLNGTEALATSRAVILPVASQVAKKMAGGLAGFAVIYAIEKLIGAGVSYINDAQNSRILYTPNSDDNQKYQYSYHYQNDKNAYPTKFFTPTQLFNEYKKNYNDNSQVQRQYFECHYSGNNKIICTSGNKGSTVANSSVEHDPNNNPLYNPNYQNPTEQSKSYLDIAAQVIADANTGKSESVAYVGSVADSWIQDDERIQYVPKPAVLNQLQKNTAYDTKEKANTTPNPASSTNPDQASQTQASGTTVSSSSSSTTTLPKFCEYAPFFCDKDIPEDDDTKVPVKDLQLEYYTTNRFFWSATCPQPVVINLPSFMGNSNSITFSYNLFCDFLANVAPFVKAISYFLALKILTKD
jgi:hypothetical protein